MTTTRTPSRTARLTTLNKAGIVLAVLLALGDVGSAFVPTPDGETGPPYAILLFDGLLGVATLVAVVLAFRTLSRGALRVVAGTRVLSAITALPTFFVDVPDWLKALAGLGVVMAVASAVMVLTPPRGDDAAVLD